MKQHFLLFILSFLRSVIGSDETPHAVHYIEITASSSPDKDWFGASNLCVATGTTTVETYQVDLLSECATLMQSDPVHRAWLEEDESNTNNAYVVAQGDATITSIPKESVNRIKGVCCAPVDPAVRGFEERRERFINAVLDPSIEGPSDIVLEAFRGLPLTQSLLFGSLERITGAPPPADWELAFLVRVLYFTNGEYDDQIMPKVEQLQPFWMHFGDLLQDYWTEHHMILWDSSAYLLKQHFPELTYNDDLEKRLTAFLKLKRDYGYFQVNSAKWFPYTMSALLNLADFSEDVAIKDLAKEALDVLLLEVIDNVNSEGYFYPAQGRTLQSRFGGNREQNDKITQLLTGRGPEFTDAKADKNQEHTVFLATTSVQNLLGILGTWQAVIDNKQTHHGLTLAEFDAFLDAEGITGHDRTAFKMTATLDWTPEVYQDTIDLIDHFGLQQHKGMKDIYPLFKWPSFPIQWLEPTTRGAAINDIDSVLYKNGPVMLSSFTKYNYQLLGWQQYPFVATTGSLSVFAKSGLDPIGGRSNIHLPFVKQSNNVAVIKYNSGLWTSPTNVPDPNFYVGLFTTPPNFVTDIKSVRFRFLSEIFDEVFEDPQYSNWILGKEVSSDGVEGYVALRRDDNCINGVVDGYITCPDQDQQVYALFVGSSDEYGSFDGFKAKVSDSTWDSGINELVIDGTTVSVGPFVVI